MSETSKFGAMKEASATRNSVANSSSTEDDHHHHQDWDAKAQPLSNLFQSQIILSPCRGEGDDFGEEKAPVVAGEIIDFDDHSSTGGKHDDENEYDLDMFDNLFDEGNQPEEEEEEEEPKQEEEEEKEPGATAQEETKASGDHVVTSDEEDAVSESSKSKRTKDTKDDDQEDGDRPVKKSKTKDCDAPPVASIVVEPKKKKVVEIKIEHLSIPLPPEPRKPLPGRRRPNCLFVNHFGTRLDEKGHAVQLNVPVKICSSETVSIKTKSTAASSKSSKSGCTHKTPVKNVASSSVNTSDSESPSCSVPSVVRIVTPNVKKPVTTSSARIEDIHMEEDDLMPLHHEDHEVVIDCEDLPYIHSLTAAEQHQHQHGGASNQNNNNNTPSPVHGQAGPHMIPGAMMGGHHGAGMPHLNFHRPFPLLQRRAFLTGSYPMAAHPQAAFMHGWPGAAGFGGPGMTPFPPQHMASFGPHGGMEQHGGGHSATTAGGSNSGPGSDHD